VGLINLNGSFTVEMWVKFDKNVQYFAGNETWPGVTVPGVSRTAGWVLRIEDDQRLNFTVASFEGDWFKRGGSEIAFDNRWHHLAVSKGNDAIGLFLDGNEYLRIDSAKTKFVPAPFDICLGSRLTVPDRTIHCAFRAFRVSSTNLYTKPFMPPEHLEKTGDTRLLLDFSVGKGNSLPDLSGGDRDGRITGGRWSTLSQ
jgi:hypothetical protein